jgi:hypothetical protein
MIVSSEIEMEKDFDISRRKALKKFAKGSALAICGFAGGVFAVPFKEEMAAIMQLFIHERVVETLGPSVDVKDGLKNLFLGSQEKISIIPAQNNPNVAVNKSRLEADPYEIFTHTTLEVARSFAKILDQTEGRLTRVDQLFSVNGEGNLLTFGSPTSNLIAQIALRYGDIGDGTAGSNHVRTDAFDLKILYELNGSIIKSMDSVHRSCYRTVNGRIFEIPNWGVQDSTGIIRLPETRDGALVQDYLVISSLPNTLSRTALDSGHRIINIGGTHSEGTLAAKGLLINDSLLRELEAKVRYHKGNSKDDPFWQAIILVDCPSPDKLSLRRLVDFAVVSTDPPKLERLTDENMKIFRRFSNT